MSRRWLRPRRAAGIILGLAFLFGGWVGWWSPALDWRVATGCGGHFAKIRRDHKPDVAILPIGAYVSPRCA